MTAKTMMRLHQGRRTSWCNRISMLVAAGSLLAASAAHGQTISDEPALAPLPLEWKVLRLTLDGYLRVRGEVYNDLDLSRGPTPTTGQPIFPVPAGGGESHTLTGLDMRLRLEPTLAIGQAVRIHVRADVLDNVGFGSTPDVLGTGGSSYATQSAMPLESGVNALHDGIRVKRAWGEVTLPFGILSAGRMGGLVSWGTGFFVNDGGCLSCDHGDSGDRIALTVPLLGHYVTALYELSASGPYAVPFAQPIDLDRRAHVDTFALAIARYDSPEAQRRRLAAGKTLLQYGFLGSYRAQDLDAPGWTRDGGLLAAPSSSSYLHRGAKVGAFDLWVLVHHGGLRLELEAAAVIGRIDDASNIAGVSFTKPATLTQLGAVANVAYTFRFPLRLRLDAGFASGDDAPGFGVRVAPGQTTTTRGDLDGPQLRPPADYTVDNFRFHPDYHVDLILWRRIIGQVSDAMYLRPSVLVGPFGPRTSAIAFEAAAIGSRAIYATSPPGQDANLGVEIDLRARWRIEPAFEVDLAWGLFLPGAGFKNLDLHLDPHPAQTVELLLAYRM